MEKQETQTDNRRNFPPWKDKVSTVDDEIH